MKKHLSALSDSRSTGNRKLTCQNSPVVFGTGLIALDIILSAYGGRPPLLAAGGTCGNVLAVLSFLGWDAFPIARLSDDVASETVTADLKSVGVHLEFARQAPSAPTPIILQRNDRTREGKPRHRFSVACPACGAWYPSFRAVTIEGAESVIETVGDVLHSGFAPRVFFFDRVSRGALQLAHWFAEVGALVVFEPIGVGDPKLFAEALSLAHIVKYSNERLHESAVSPPRRNRPLLEIQTLGDAGLRYRSERNARSTWVHLKSIASSAIVDTAGAGDWLTAAFLCAVGADGVGGFTALSPRDIRDALHISQAAASVACEHEGARGAMSVVDRIEFDHRVASLLRGETHSDCRSTESSSPVDSNPSRDPLAREVVSSSMKLEAVCPACPS